MQRGRQCLWKEQPRVPVGASGEDLLQKKAPSNGEGRKGKARARGQCAGIWQRLAAGPKAREGRDCSQQVPWESRGRIVLTLPRRSRWMGRGLPRRPRALVGRRTLHRPWSATHTSTPRTGTRALVHGDLGTEIQTGWFPPSPEVGPSESGLADSQPPRRDKCPVLKRMAICPRRESRRVRW